MTVLDLPRASHTAVPAPSGAVTLHLTGLACALGGTVLPAAEAIKAGRYDPEQAARDGYVSLRQARVSVPEMANDVAARALCHAGLPGRDLGLISFTSIHEHGQGRLWQPAAQLQHRLDASAALAWSMSFGCNGLSLGLVQAGLMQPRLSGPALVVGADRFEGTSFDRWRSDRGLAYGDAAAAVVLSRDPGFAEIRYLTAEYIPQLEGLHRRDDDDVRPEVQVDDPAGSDWDINACKQAFMQRNGKSAFFDALSVALDRLEAGVLTFLDQSGIRLKAVVTPFVGESVRASTYDARFHPLAPLNTGQFGASVGHTGTSDQFLGFAHLIDSGAIRPGDCALLIGAGAGFSLSAMVLRLNQQPSTPIIGDA